MQVGILKDAYFVVPLKNESRIKISKVSMEGDIYQFLCFCFGLGPAPRIFAKLMKVSIALMRRLNVRLIIYLDDILILASTRTELKQARDTLIFLLLILLQQLSFLINLKKSEFQPVQKIQFLGINIDSRKMFKNLYLSVKECWKNQWSQ